MGEGLNRMQKWERKDPYKTLGIGLPLRGLKAGDIIKKGPRRDLKEERGKQGLTHYLIKKVERIDQELYLEAAPFSPIIYYQTIKDCRKGTKKYSFMDLEISREEAKEYSIITDLYEEYWGERLLESSWRRKSSYDLLGIGSPFPDLKEGDILAESTDNYSAFHHVIVGIKREKGILILDTAAFGYFPSYTVYLSVLAYWKKKGGDRRFTFGEVKISRENEKYFKNVTHFYWEKVWELPRPKAPLQEWERGDHYKTLGIGSLFPDIEVGDILIAEGPIGKTNHLVVEIGREKGVLKVLTAPFSIIPSHGIISTILRDKRRKEWSYEKLEISWENLNKFELKKG